MTLAEESRLTREDLTLIDAYWRAANYLSVGQIYLLANPLLSEPLRPDHIKPRLLGHWGTTPGLNFIWVHLNRAIVAGDLNMMYVIGPGHGGPAALANCWLEGTYSEVYPSVPQDAHGMAELFRQFSFPGGVPSHVAPETPGSINEGGELGYSLAHAYGAAFDNPDLLVACVIGDGEAETGALATSWHSNKTDGRRPRRCDRGHPGHTDPCPRRGAGRTRRRAAALAHDRAAQPEGLDRAGCGGWCAGGRHMAVTSGTPGWCTDQSGASAPARGLDAVVPAR